MQSHRGTLQMQNTDVSIDIQLQANEDRRKPSKVSLRPWSATLQLLLTLAAQRLRNVVWYSVAIHSLHEAPRQQCGVSLGRGFFCNAIVGRLIMRRLATVLPDHQHCLLPLCVLCSRLDLHAGAVMVAPHPAAELGDRLRGELQRQL